MIVFTDYDETPLSLTRRLTGRPNKAMADAIWKANQKTMAVHIANHSGRFASNWPIWIPGISPVKNSVNIQHGIKRLEFVPPPQRIKLAQLIRSGVDPNHLIGMSHCILHHNRKNNGEAFFNASLGATAAQESALRVGEQVHHQAEKFTESMEALNHRMAEYHRVFKAKEGGGAIKAAENALKAQHAETVKELNKHATFFARRMSGSTHHRLGSSKRLVRASRKGFIIENTDDFKKVTRVARSLKFLGPTAIAVSCASGASEVYETYQDGGDVFAKVVGVGAEIALTTVTGIGMTMAFIAGGWVTLIVGGVVGGIALAIEGKFAEKVGETIAHEIEGAGKAMSEEYHHLRNWMSNVWHHWV